MPTPTPDRVLGRWLIVHRPPLVLIKGRRAGDILRRHGFKPLWSVTGKGWVVDDEHLADVAAIAALRTLGYRVLHADDADCDCVTLRGEGRECDEDPSDLCVCSSVPIAAVTLLAEQLGAVEIGHVHRGEA